MMGALLLREGPAELDPETITLLDPVDIGYLAIDRTIINDLADKMDTLQAILGSSHGGKVRVSSSILFSLGNPLY